MKLKECPMSKASDGELSALFDLIHPELEDCVLRRFEVLWNKDECKKALLEAFRVIQESPASNGKKAPKKFTADDLEQVLKVEVEKHALEKMKATFVEYERRLVGFVVHSTSNSWFRFFDAEDVVNSAWRRVQEEWASFLDSEKRMPVTDWLYRKTRQCQLDMIRKHEQDQKKRSPGDLHDADTPSRRTTPSSALQRQITRSRVRRVLEELEEVDRVILVLKSMEDRQYEEIGSILGITNEAARVRHLRARKRFKEEWKELYGSDEVDI